MKKRFLLLIFLCSGYFLQAQLSLAVKGGLSTTSLDPSDFSVIDENGLDELLVSLQNARYGIHAGIAIRGTIKERFLIQPEILFNSNSVDFAITDLNNATTLIKQEKYQYFDVPLLFGVQFGAFRIHLGPEAHFFVDSISDLSDFDGYQEEFDTMTLGWLGGIGFDIWNLWLDIRYEGNFTKFGNHIAFYGNSYAFDQAPQRLLVSLGFRLLGKKKEKKDF